MSTALLRTFSYRRARWVLRGLRASQSGLALLEFALILPVFVMLIFGGTEIANITIVTSRISALTSMVADGTARVRDRIDESDINDIIEGVKASAGSLNLTSRGRIIISTVEDNAATTTPTNDQVITWQRCKGTKTVTTGQSIGVEGEVLTSGIGETGRTLTATPGNPVIVVQIFYDYQPIVPNMPFSPSTISYQSAFTVRDRSLQTMQNGQNLAASAKATCNFYTS